MFIKDQTYFKCDLFHSVEPHFYISQSTVKCFRRFALEVIVYS